MLRATRSSAAALLFLLALAGCAPSRAPSNANPAYSPDGEWVAFDSAREGHRDIHVVRARGGAPRRVSHDPGDETRPAWNADGSRILFWSDAGGTPALRSVPFAGGASEPFAFGAFGAVVPRWSPGGARAAWVGVSDSGAALWIADRGGAARLWRSNANGLGEPAWSPDGRFIAYARTIDSDRELFAGLADADADLRLTFARGTDDGPSFTPDGKRLAFESDRDEEGVFQTWLYDLETGTARRLTHGPDFHRMPRFSTAREEILVETNRWGGRDLARLDPATGEIRRLLTPGR
jgi:TolB protein